MRKAPKTLRQRAQPRWLAVTAALGALLVLYTNHPYYQGELFEPWRPMAWFIFGLWVVLGLPYTMATLRRFPGRAVALTDGALHLLVLARAARVGRLAQAASNRRVRNTLAAMAVKAFFLPLMTNFFAGHTTGIANLWATKHGLQGFDFHPHGSLGEILTAWWAEVGSRLPNYLPGWADLSALLHPGSWTRADVWWGLDLAYNVTFFIDCTWATAGYALESRWLGNKTKSVEPTGLGWVVALGCYPPFNDVLGLYLPVGGGPQLIHSEGGRLALKAATIGLFAIYTSATVAFGLKFSNLTNRGIITRGPYAYIRHPAYATKCTAWWLENLPTLTVPSAVFLTGTCCVYALRAWTEERHLSRDPAYLAYKKQVPWAAFPGLF